MLGMMPRVATTFLASCFFLAGCGKTQEEDKALADLMKLTKGLAFDNTFEPVDGCLAGTGEGVSVKIVRSADVFCSTSTGMTKTWFRDETNAKVVWVYKTGPVQPAQLKEMNEYCDTGKIPERLTCDSPTASKSNATSYQNCYADRAESQKAIAKKFGFDFD